MKSLISTIALIGFLSVALFGFSQLSNMENGKCVAETYAGSVCHVIATTEQFSFHVSAFSSFLSSIGGSAFLSLLGFALLMTFALFALFVYRPPALAPIYARTNYELESPPSRRKLLRYLALFENSPSDN